MCTDRIVQRIILALLVSVLTACGQAVPLPTVTPTTAPPPTVTPTTAPPPTSTPTAAPPPTSTPAAPTQSPTLDATTGLKQVETFLNKVYEQGLFTGAALIAHDGKIVLSKAWGMANREKNIPNTPQTIFRVGENTKQFTAAAILLLKQDGKLSVQDPICNYLDNCPEVWKVITIHNLLSHTSGIPDYFDPPMPGVSKLTQEGATPQQIVALFRDRPLAFKPGAQVGWNHSDFVLAGLIVERVSGQPYSDFVKQRIFEPLGMAHSGYGDPPEGLALGYANASTKTPVTLNVSALYASGGCYSTAEDLFLWSEGLYNGRLLNETELQKMLTPYAFDDNGGGIGYGVVVFELAGRKAAGNGGGPDGYGSYTTRYFDDHVTSLLIGNQNMNVTVIDEMEKTFFSAATLTLKGTSSKDFAPDFEAVHSPVNNDPNEFLIFGKIPVSPAAQGLSPELAAFLGRWEGYDYSPPVKKDYKIILVIQDISAQGGKAFLWLGTNLQYPSSLQKIHFQVIPGTAPAIEFDATFGDSTQRLLLTYDPDKKLLTSPDTVHRPLELSQNQSFYVYKDYSQYLASNRIFAKEYQNKDLPQYGKGYMLYLPEGYEDNPTKTWPLIFFLHGAGDRGDNIYLLAKASPFMMIREKRPLPFIIVAPLLDASQDVFPIEYLDGVLAKAQATYRVDPKRIYVTGLSLGGEATYRFAIHQPNTFAAIAPLSAWLDADQISLLDRIKSLPVWAIHGADDFIIPLAIGEHPVGALKKLGGNIQFTVLEGHDHDTWTDTYSDPAFYDWLLQHQRP